MYTAHLGLNDSGYDLFLRNNRKMIVDLTDQLIYSFKPTETTIVFSLHLKLVSTMVKSIIDDIDIVTYCENKVITIINDEKLPQSGFEIFSIKGEKIVDGTLKTQIQVPILEEGIYLIVIYNKMFSCVKKIIVF